MLRKIVLAIWVAALLALMALLSMTARPGPWHEIWDRSGCAPHCQP